ncbi:MAG: hypothetical protein K6G37_03645, partial [Bacilli bacterium]|nr:hypothetical protein [Bacilli bacterium]
MEKVSDSNIAKGMFSASSKDFEDSWEKIIKGSILSDASDVIIDEETGEKTLRNPYLCDMMLNLSDDITKTQGKALEAYKKLAGVILKEKEIAFSSYCGQMTFIEKLLNDHKIELTDFQKNKVVKMATKHIEEVMLTNDIPFKSLSEYDVRYEILRNPNWTTQEKIDIAKSLYDSEENFESYLDAWFDDFACSMRDSNNEVVNLDVRFLFQYNYWELENIFQAKHLARSVQKEIKFFDEMNIVLKSFSTSRIRI